MTCGAKKNVRYTFFIRIVVCSNTAAKNPDTNNPGTCKIVNHNVFFIDVCICGSVNTH